MQIIRFQHLRNYKCSDSLDEIFQFIQYWEKNRSKLPFEIDGVVLKVNDFYQREILDSPQNFPDGQWHINSNQRMQGPI